MKKITFETKDFVSFDPPEWKQISLNPVIYEAQKDETILKFQGYEKSDAIIQSFHRKIFNKGEQVEVSIIGDKFQLSFDYRELRTGEKSSYDMEI